MTVYDAAVKRIDVLFREFDNIYISFSGGKDSAVLLNLCIDYIRKNNLDRKIGVFHLDYEAQYRFTTDYVDEVLMSNQDIFEVYRCCVPFKVTTCTSMYEPFWRPWDPDKKNIWVRQMPEAALTESDFPFFKQSLWDYDFQTMFSEWLHKKKKAKRTACLVGIRTQESLHRWRAIHSERNYKNFQDLKWTKEVYSNVFNAYPIYDWLTTDVWTANSKFSWSYNKIYDLYYKAGLNIEQMRVASPFLSAAQDTLRLYQVIEPDTWAKLVGRVNGVNFTGIYGGTTAMGWQSITKPPGHTWESYMHFLLKTLPEETRAGYLEKLSTSIKFWRDKGGVLSADIVDKLKSAGVKIEVASTTAYKTKKLPVKMEYLDEIDIAEAKEIPTFKRMCICIMKNDHLCKYMGFSLTKNEMARRKNIMEKYKSLL